MPKDKLVKYTAYLLGIFVLFSFSFLRAFEPYELQTLDLRFKLRPPLKVSPDIVIIEIAEDTTKEIGRWPFDRGYHADLINYLSQLGAKAVVFDTPFGDKSASDAELAEQTEKAGCLVYYPLILDFNGRTQKGRLSAKRVEVPLLPELAKSAKGVGFINAVPDVDGKLRRFPLKIECGGREYLQLAYLVAKDNFGKKADKVPVDAEGYVLLNYPGRWTKTFKHYSFADILVSVEALVNGQKGRISLDDLHGKVCFVGVTEAGGVDIRANPIEVAYPMVGAHASLLNSILTGQYLVRAGRPVNILLLFVLCVPVAVIAHRAKPIIGLRFFLSSVAAFAVLGLILFVFFGIWIDIFYPVVIAFVIYLGTTVYKYLIERRNRMLLDKELSIAKEIQMDFLPQSVPQIEGVEIASSIDTAKAVGGDLYDFADFAHISAVGQKKLGVMIGDVSGKGVPAALFMARAIADFRHFSSNGGLKPSLVLNELNRQIALNYKSNLFITMFYMIYDPASMELVFSNAGHLPAILLRNGGKMESLKTEGTPLGLIDTETYLDSSVTLRPGDSVILYTDGVTEARSRLKEEFGEERLKQVVLKNHYASPLPMINAIKSELARFVGAEPQHDDLTIIVLKVKD